MRILLLAIFLCGLRPGTAAAQYQKTALELQTDSLLAGLRTAGVDTICVYESYCVGCRGSYLPNDSPCRTKGIYRPTYLLWRQAGRSYGRRLDNCSISRSQELAAHAFWPYFLAHRQQIKKEKIKKFVHFDHGVVAYFRFYISLDTASQYFEPINLVKAIKHPSRRNRYYRYNTRTHTVALYKLLEATIATEFLEPK